MVKARVLKAPEIERAPQTLTGVQTEQVIDAARTARDRLLLTVLVEAGLRIGEALGLRREDMHLLPDSTHLGCRTGGAHLHVRPRQDNVNGARAKAGRPRMVPLTPEVVHRYRDHLAEREQVVGSADCDYVFLNLVGVHAGRPLSYSNTKQVIERIGRRCGLTARPHMMRHTAATRWIRNGVAPDVVQTLLGHASSASTAVYLHAQDEDLRAAVAAVAAVESLAPERPEDGHDYSTSHRRALLRHWRTFLEYARQAGMMDHVPGGFALNPRFHSIAAVEVTEDDLGRAIPEHVIAQLDVHLGLLGASTGYASGGWRAADFARMYQVVYAVLRDTGRRPGEVTSLHRDCLERVDGKPTLIYDNHKRRRHGRRLPISETTAQLVETWQKELDALPAVPACAQWLFPSPGQRNRPRRGHLNTSHFCNRIFRNWVDELIPDLVDDRLDEDGAPHAYDRTQVVPYGFRHAYAQRHADAGTRPDVLRELMDHRSLDVTMGYYKVSLSRKQEAVRTVAALAVDRHGAARGFGDPLAYEVESVGDPYGGCTEPSNVKAGGGHCQIRFQCAGCDFYRPDPSYLPALEQQIADLRADKEAALAMEAADWVVRNLDDQIRAYSKSADEMRRKLDALPAEERAAVESASRELRKARSAAAFIPLQALTTRSSE
ncbi:site-specific integrase [Streptomyces sp. V3I7]|uniref:site-specific integrase n=1 Tax=Streptomyces sp. V3I7 TaxID=3042278 RepID=UPI0027D7F96E|nr:site-specific integrase [Streptomyces sp. V3I7]